MEYFIVQEGQMWNPIHDILKEKAAQGVSVYFMYDDFGCISTLPWHYHKVLCNEGIHCVIANRFSPVLSHIHNNRDHRKITIIDGCVGFTGGVNLADEYINAVMKHGHWKDTAVKIEGGAVRNLMSLFLVNWNTQSKEPIDYTKYMKMQWSPADCKGVVIPFGSGSAPIYTDTIGKNVYLNMINAAKCYLYITTPYLIWCWERFFVTSIRLQRFTKSLLPRMAPTTASPEAGMMRSLVNSIFIFFIGLCPCPLVFHCLYYTRKCCTNGEK